ncbi:hypothetical protein [Streptomyces tauricus]|uniref:hypothetical protein n=1 Tax=Streptomyces tauricus TaxID=68274 RepID=UPI002E2C3868|nr:hypothetical protein [Streptomyces tauricus]
MEAASAQAAALLRARGVRPGDRVTLFDIRCVAEDDSVEVRLLGETGRDVAPGSIGEPSVHGPNVLKGYWNRPQQQDPRAGSPGRARRDPPRGSGGTRTSVTNRGAPHGRPSARSQLWETVRP